MYVISQAFCIILREKFTYFLLAHREEKRRKEKKRKDKKRKGKKRKEKKRKKRKEMERKVWKDKKEIAAKEKNKQALIWIPQESNTKK